MVSTSTKMEQYLADDPPSIVPLTIKPHFDALSHAEKLYAHYLSLASFAGYRVVLRQVSPESEALYDIILDLHAHCGGDYKKLAKEAGVADVDITDYLNFAAQFLGNGGNFKSFGDSQFVPRLSLGNFQDLAKLTEKSKNLFPQVAENLYSMSTKRMHLGYQDEGHTSTYYPRDSKTDPTMTKQEITALSDTVAAKGILPENTRVHKTASGDFDVLISSAERAPADRDSAESSFKLDGPLAGHTAKLVYGDHATEMSRIASAFKQAQPHAANEHQSEMLKQYTKSFETGSMEAFKASQRAWIQDKGMTVESNIGFIETYRDPHGIRGEWEGLVAMVNKERTRAFKKLVDAAPDFIPKLPWSKEFEKDRFLAPEFTSLEVLTFAGSGIPAGINLPNFDDIRQVFGFKNVSLNNVLSASAPNETIPFIHPDDMEMYRKNRDLAFEVQVGLHELLGHGCGKLLQETSPGQFNFDKASPPINPLTNQPVTSWYKPGQTFMGLFGSLGGPFEECRAEVVSMCLVCDFDVLRIFDVIGDSSKELTEEKLMAGPGGDLIHSAYLWMARAGLAALEHYDPGAHKWGQAHMQARFSILRVLLEHGKGVCKLEFDEEGSPSVRIDRKKILKEGRECMDGYLQELHIHKAVADVDGGKNLFEGLTDLVGWCNGDEDRLRELREHVLRKKVPRKVFVQAGTELVGGGKDVQVREYPATAEGMIASHADRERDVAKL